MVRDAEETGVWGGERRNRAMWRFYDGQGHHHFSPWVKSCFSMIEGWQQGTGTWQFERQKKLVLWTLGNNNKLDKSSIRGAANNSYFQHQLVYRLFSQSSCSLWNVTNQWKNSHHNFSEPRMTSSICSFCQTTVQTPRIFSWLSYDKEKHIWGPASKECLAYLLNKYLKLLIQIVNPFNSNHCTLHQHIKRRQKSQHAMTQVTFT